MSKVRGKDPLKVNFVKEVYANSYNQTVSITAEGFDGTRNFLIVGTLQTHCVRELILDLRKALRQVRDETRKRLDNHVTESEVPLA